METFIAGIFVGLAVAAPVGPIAILCIHRTLKRGVLAGLFTGLGAATADATYGLVAALGLVATGVLVSYASPLRIAGGILILLLGLMSLRNFFATHRDVQPEDSGKGLVGAFAGTYALTLSNPMTILAFAGLIAGLSAGDSGGAFYLVAGVFAGSALWWLILVTLTRSIGKRLSADATKHLDLVSGIVLVGWGLWALFAGGA